MPQPPPDPNDAFYAGLDGLDRRLRALETILGGTGAGPPAVPGVIPIGGIIMWPLSALPTNFLSANGQFVSKSTYALLYNVYGIAYGDGGTTFGLPNLNRRAPFGPGSGMNVSETENLAETVRGPRHHHHLSGGLAVSVADGGYHSHAYVGDHSHGTPSGEAFAMSVGNTGNRGTSATQFNLVSGWQYSTAGGGGHDHGGAGTHNHGASGSIDLDSSGGGGLDTVGFLVVSFAIRAL